MTQNKSIDVLLKSFDIYSTCVAYDGTNVWMTDEAHLSYKHMNNIVLEDKYNAFYCKRLVKYYKYGFDITLPQLDITKLKVKQVNIIDNISFYINEINGTDIVISDLVDISTSENKSHYYYTSVKSTQKSCYELCKIKSKSKKKEVKYQDIAQTSEELDNILNYIRFTNVAFMIKTQPFFRI